MSAPQPMWRRARRAAVPVLAVLATLLSQRPATAFTFILFDGHTDQIGTWYSNGPNGQAFSVNGQIPFTGSPGLAGAELLWTAGSSAFRLIAVPTAASRGTSISSAVDRWGAVDGRAVPLTFLLFRESEPPGFTTDLYIRPRLYGTVELLTSASGIASVTMQLMMAVTVNDQQVARDSLFLTTQTSGGQNSVFPVSFPKGTANYVLAPGVHEGSQIGITFWAYFRGTIAGTATADAYFSLGGPFYSGPGVVLDILSADAVAVADEPAPPQLSFAAHPNPFPGSTRIRYTLPAAAQVRLSIYDLAGHRVATPVDRFESAGEGEVVWDGRDAHGASLAAGVYFAELTAGVERTVGKLVMLGR